MKPLIFWRHTDFGSTDKVEGSDNKSPLPPVPVLVSGTPKQSEKLLLHHVLGEQYVRLHVTDRCSFSLTSFALHAARPSSLTSYGDDVYYLITVISQSIRVTLHLLLTRCCCRLTD